MPYIEVVVPLGIPTSEPLVAARTLPAKERPLNYTLQTGAGERWFSLNRTTGQLTLRGKAQQRVEAQIGTSVIKIYCVRRLTSYKLKTFFMARQA
jgi:hypothetical protein